jgi:DNA-binding CsgD family transcriptional regulator
MKEVGLVLKITTRTLAFHKHRVMKVLNAKNDLNLVQDAIKHHTIAA